MVQIKRSSRKSSRRASNKRRSPIYNKNAKGNSKSWGKNKPTTKKERVSLKKTCGAKCFGVPSTMKFPVCPKHIKTPSDCGPDCVGLISAYRRANILKDKYPGLAQKLRRSAKRAGCKWVR